jgi:transcriptional regulator with XRE-family HTH domain
VKTDETLKKLGKRVKDLRLQKGITSQMALANKAHLDRTYIGGIERGERNLTIKAIEKVANALGVKLEDLFRF